MSLGSSNGSNISTSGTSQTNGIYFGDGNYATILNSNGQAIDVASQGSAPTTWSGTSTPGGSRRLVIYEVEVVEIEDDACYTIAFNAKTSGNTWGLRSGTTEASPNANATGDVYVAHSYTNSDGNKRWIFVNNSDGTYLAYHGQANTNFDTSNAINEWNIASLTAGSGNVSADANCSGKVCITNDKRYTNNTDAGCYIVKEENGAYDNSTAPYYNGNFTSALTFTATGDAVSSTATLAIEKFEALQTFKSYKSGNVHMPALFPTDAVTAVESTVTSGVHAATTTSEIATALDDLYEIAEGRKFYAVQSTATGQYMNIGTSQITATSTTLNTDAVLEVEYAGNGKFYLKGYKSGYYAGNPSSGSANPGTHVTTGDAQALYIGNNGSTDNQVYFAAETSGNRAIHYNSGYSGYVVAWAHTAGASQWNITACEVSDVTYNVILEASGTVKDSNEESVVEVIGGPISLPSDLTRDYCTYTYYSDAACTSPLTTYPNDATATVYALASYTLPFTVSSNFATATWYYMNGHATYSDRYISTNGNAIVWSVGNKRTDAYKWAFLGNPYDGIKVVNKAAGETKFLQETNPLTMATTDKAWPIKQQTNTTWYSGSNGFGFWSDANSNYVNAQSSTLKYWGSFDQGSTFWVEEVVPVAVGDLSNAKKYRITCNGGSLSTYTDGEDGTFLASPIKSALSISGKDFAIINYGGKYYLYSVNDEKFVTYQTSDKAPLADVINSTSDQITFAELSSGVYAIKFDGSTNKYLNSSSGYTYGIVISDWGGSGYWDDGNQYVIEEVGDFDATDALAALDEFFTPVFNDAIAALEAYPYGTGLNQYSLVVEETDRTSQAATIIAGLKSQGCSSENLAIANVLIAGSTLNMPATGKFYRIQGHGDTNSSDKYLAAGLAANNKFNMSTETDATTIFYFDGTKLTNFSSGLCNGMTASAWAWVVGESASTVAFGDGETNGGYSIQSANAYFYDGNTSADRGGSLGADGRYRSWYLTEVTSLPITFKGEYASFYSPVDLTIPDNANLKVYTGTMNGNKSYLLLSEITTGTLPANTGVILHLDGWTEETSINFHILSTVASGGEGDLRGTIAAASVSANSTLVLGKVKVEEEDVWGIYKYSGTTLGGFKAYMNLTDVTGGEAKGLRFIFEDSETTGVNEVIGKMSEATDGAVYDLQGRKVANPSRGLYIINGHKVVIK